MKTTVDTLMLRTNNDCRSLLGFDEQHAEVAKPCPKCGGRDRLHVTSGWFFCRQCHPKRGDCIELMQWLHGCDFKAAVALLGAGQRPILPMPMQRTEQKRKPMMDKWQEHAGQLATESHERLWSSAGKPAQEYLEKRGLSPGTWMQFGIGYRTDVPLPGAYGYARRPAIVLPWRMSSGVVTAIRYRFMDSSEYMDSDGEWRTAKMTAETGSQFASKLFGGQAIHATLPQLRKLRTLVLCEGEINAMSIWQVAQDTLLDVLSLGSEGQVITPVMVKLAADYRQVIVWTDKENVSRSIVAKTPGALAYASPVGKDANDLLREGLLGGVLSRLRLAASATPAARDVLRMSLFDAADTLHGIDGGSAQVLRELWPNVGVYEAEPGRWITER